MREYKSGTRWCLWRWKDIGYLKRLHVVQTPYFSICCHWIISPDQERDLHDHPVSFLSIILRGGYTDVVRVARDGLWGTEQQIHRFIRYIPGTFWWTHRIVAVKPKTLTLCFMTPNKREWGFHTANGWVHWKNYEALNRSTSP